MHELFLAHWLWEDIVVYRDKVVCSQNYQICVEQCLFIQVRVDYSETFSIEPFTRD